VLVEERLELGTGWLIDDILSERPWKGGHKRSISRALLTSGGVQHESTATCPDPDGLEWTLRDGDLRRWTRVDVLPAVRGPEFESP
jgi:hypothetical protein